MKYLLLIISVLALVGTASAHFAFGQQLLRRRRLLQSAERLLREVTAR